MRLRFLAPLLLLISLPLNGGITSLVQETAAPSGCGEFTDDFSGANLDDWDVHSNYSLDTGNDELDHSGSITGSSKAAVALYTASATTDKDHFVKVKMVSGQSENQGPGLILRSPKSCTNNKNAYNIVDYQGDIYISVMNTNADCEYSWSCDVGLAFSDTISDGDVLAASVSGTGSGTVFKIWVNPDAGDCPDDWGVADDTTTGCGSCCVDADNKYVGIGPWPEYTQSFSFDDFVGGDN